VNGLEMEDAGNIGFVIGIVGRMAAAVEHGNLAKIEGRKTFQARDVDAKFVRVRAPLVMSVDPADCAEMMLGGFRVEAIGP